MDESQTLSDYAAGEIRAALARRRSTGKELAEKLQVSRSWVSYRLTGTTEITLNDLERIATALEVEVGALLPPAKKVDRLAYPRPATRPHGPRTTADLLMGHPADHPWPHRTTTRTTPRRPAIRQYRHEGVPA